MLQVSTYLPHSSKSPWYRSKALIGKRNIRAGSIDDLPEALNTYTSPVDISQHEMIRTSVLTDGRLWARVVGKEARS